VNQKALRAWIGTLAAAGTALALNSTAGAAAPGITGGTGSVTFDLIASEGYLSQPDGQTVYSWGFGCHTQPTGFVPAAIAPPPKGCPSMQVPAPTLVVKEGETVSITLHNNLPTAAGNTSILFPGFTLTSTCPAPAVQGLLTCEAPPTGSVTYTFKASSPGTRAYYSGTHSDLQVEMGLYGAIIVLPATPPTPCGNLSPPTSSSLDGLPTTNPGANKKAKAAWIEADFRLASAAYDQARTCYDREYLFQFSEMDPNIHNQALAQKTAIQASGACLVNGVVTPGNPGCSLNVPTEPYHPAYFMINGRSMPDDMDPNYAAQYPHQPYNGNPHMHPGELVLLRIIGQGRWQHPFHEHGNHVRILARDGNLIQSQTDPNSLAGPLLFTTTTTPGLAMDGIFYWTGKGLNWDAYGHNPTSSDPNATLQCNPDANGYNTGAPTAINYFEWCQDHNKPLQAAPFGDVPAGGPVTLPDPNLFTNGPWFGGSPYLGPDATTRSTFGSCTGSGTSTLCSTTGTTPPSGTIANNPSSEAGFAFMWHSHNEREITTNNIFPGGMLMMMLVDSREFVIDESN
jgi:FtsP/CotA-like multicopper oxidase with cupredoxin domain